MEYNIDKIQGAFEDFLRNKHAENYSGTDDDMPDAFDGWISELDASELMDYEEEFNQTNN